jgi:hypothetical protein
MSRIGTEEGKNEALGKGVAYRKRYGAWLRWMGSLYREPLVWVADRE